MRIGFDAKRAFNNYTGLGNYARSLIGALVDYHPENQYFLYTPSFKIPFIKESENVHWRSPQKLYEKIGPSLWRTFNISTLAQKDKLDLYHGLSHEIPMQIEKSGVKSIVTIHDLIYLKFPELFAFVDRKVYDFKFRSACEKADHIIAISKQTKRDIMEHFKIQEEKISVVYQSCLQPFWNQNIDEELEQKILNKYNLAPGYIIYVGSLVERKNIMRLLQAYKNFSGQITTSLVLVGRGDKYKALLKKYIEKHNLVPFVHFIEEISTKDLAILYKNARFSVYPSLYEGFGIPVIESILCGTPVITSRGSCLSEAGGEGALYIDPYNTDELLEKIELLYKDQKLLEELKQKGFQHVQQFSSQKVIQNLLKVYSKVL